MVEGERLGSQAAAPWATCSTLYFLSNSIGARCVEQSCRRSSASEDEPCPAERPREVATRWSSPARAGLSSREPPPAVQPRALPGEDHRAYGRREHLARSPQLLNRAHASNPLHLQCRGNRGLNSYNPRVVVLGNHILPRPAKKKKQCELPTRLDEEKERLPERMQRIVFALWEEVRALEERLEAVDAELESVARDEPIIQALRQIPRCGRAHRHRLLRRGGQYPHLPQRSPSRQLARAHSERILQRRKTPVRQDQQTRGSLPTHAADPGCPPGADHRRAETAGRTIAQSAAAVGTHESTRTALQRRRRRTGT